MNDKVRLASFPDLPNKWKEDAVFSKSFIVTWDGASLASQTHFRRPQERALTCMSHVEAFATGSRFLITKNCAWSTLQKLLICLILLCVKGWFGTTHFDPLIFAVWRLPWSLDKLSKRALIAWFSFDPGCKHFYMGHISGASIFSTPYLVAVLQSGLRIVTLPHITKLSKH